MIFTWKPPGLHILLDTKSQIAMFDSRTIHIAVADTIASPFSHDLPMSHFSHFFPFPTGSDDLSLDHPCVSVPRSQQQGTPTMDHFFLRSCDILTQLPLTVWHGVAEWPLPAIVWVFVVKTLKVISHFRPKDPIPPWFLLQRTMNQTIDEFPHHNTMKYHIPLCYTTTFVGLYA